MPFSEIKRNKTKLNKDTEIFKFKYLSIEKASYIIFLFSLHYRMVITKQSFYL